MSAEEIAKEIIVAMIHKGFFDDCSNNHNQESRTDERISLISKSFEEICKTIKNS